MVRNLQSMVIFTRQTSCLTNVKHKWTHSRILHVTFCFRKIPRLGQKWFNPQYTIRAFQIHVHISTILSFVKQLPRKVKTLTAVTYTLTRIDKGSTDAQSFNSSLQPEGPKHMPSGARACASAWMFCSPNQSLKVFRVIKVTQNFHYFAFGFPHHGSLVRYSSLTHPWWS